MTKIKTFLILLLSVTLAVFISAGAVIAVNADAEPVPDVATETVDPDISTDESHFVDSFLEWLKAKYGEEYEHYYNMIIEKWGSIEAYLASFGETLPDEYQNSWDKFIAWLGEYSPIWATALAIITVIIVSAVGKKQFDKIIERVVNGKLKPVVGELNLQSRAMAAVLASQRALLGNNERFAETVDELSAAEKELKSE